jgi:hypothetical protein
MGFKKTSEIINISGSVTETANNTFTQTQVSMPLDPLNNEVFVILAMDLNCSSPSNVPATVTSVSGSLAVTSQTAVLTIANNRCLAETVNAISQGAGTIDGAAFQRYAGETPPSTLPYVAILATDDFFAQVQGVNNTAVKTLTFRLWGYRAKADAATYAALVQSELLS